LDFENLATGEPQAGVTFETKAFVARITVMADFVTSGRASVNALTRLRLQ
jgi:hypothetical protein